MRLGEFELIPISDGAFRLDGGAMFGVVPKVLWARRAPADDRNRIGLGLRPLLVRTPAMTVLIDAGAGDKYDAKTIDMYGFDRRDQLDASLAAAGVVPSAVDLVITTHLHWDHIGGLTRHVGGHAVPRFPRARHVIRRGEWDVATHLNPRIQGSYVADDFLPLLAAGLVDFVDGDVEVVPGIRVHRTGGHTQWHQIVTIASGGRTAVFMADLIPTVAHLDAPWIMGYDLYPLETLEAKTRWLAEAVSGEYVIFFEHDPAITAGIVHLEKGKPRVTPVL